MRTRKPAPKLHDLARLLYEQARSSGEDRSLTLSHGARLAYRVRGGKVRLSFARKGVQLGIRELVTFQAQCGVPAHAKRLPAEGQEAIELSGETWYRVGFIWEEEAP